MVVMGSDEMRRERAFSSYLSPGCEGCVPLDTLTKLPPDYEERVALGPSRLCRE